MLLAMERSGGTLETMYVKKFGSGVCVRVDTGRRQSRVRPVARCPAWDDRVRVMWKRIWRLCERRDPVAPSVQVMFGDNSAAPAVVILVRDTRAEKMVSLASREEQCFSV